MDENIRRRLHISGMDSRAAELARRYGLGVEITELAYAPMLDRPGMVETLRRKNEGIRSLWLHAPFAELCPCAIDPLVREVALRRYRQTLAAAQALGVCRMVVHGGFIPLVYFPEWYVEQSVQFWQEFLPEVPDGFTIALENVMEPGPQMLTDIVRQVDDPRLGLCLDVGHANTQVSAVPPLEWIALMAPWLRHVHLHNNQGALDVHAGLAEGLIPMEEMLGALLRLCPGATWTIECQDAEPSVRWLDKIEGEKL